MLQNADDASENAKEKKVLIKLNGNELVIANNGELFSEDGFRSIIYSNLSPKTMQQNKIGQKGLGFRSILSWADEIIINSGGTKLGFSEKIAQKFLENLVKDSTKVSAFIKRHSKPESPIATLRVPELLNSINDSSKIFDTTISIKLKDNILDDVQSQILSVINKETLIRLAKNQRKVRHGKIYKRKRRIYVSPQKGKMIKTIFTFFMHLVIIISKKLKCYE